jgi:hypothetical protein
MNMATDNRTDRRTSKFSWLPAECIFQLVLVVLVVGAVIERGSAIV